MASRNSPLRIIEIHKITPPLDFPESGTELTLPLTLFDTLWFKFHPVERIFFYQLSTDSSHFNSAILPKLKRSLSTSLLYFLPLAGNLIWPSHSPKPFIFYTLNDGVSLTVAESDSDFDQLSSKRTKEADTSHHYIPELFVSEEKAAIVSFQITLFPNKGFCIGVSSHHSICDGKSTIMFLKAWAYICKQLGEDKTNPVLPPELTPVFDRTIIQDPEGLEMIFLNIWATIASKSGLSPNQRSLKLMAMTPPNTKLVRGTFDLSGEDIKILRQKVPNSQIQEGLSTFVLTYAYVAYTIVKTEGLEKNKKLVLGFMADCRSRLDPPLPGNYFGNCVSPHNVETEAGFVMGENGFVFLVQKFNEAIKGIDKGVLKGAKEHLSDWSNMEPGSVEFIGVAGSQRFGVYGTDFGWGRPKMVEVTSIDRTGAISMADSSNGNGGVEVGVVLTEHEMEIFHSLFVTSLKDVRV